MKRGGNIPPSPPKTPEAFALNRGSDNQASMADPPGTRGRKSMEIQCSGRSAFDGGRFRDAR